MIFTSRVTPAIFVTQSLWRPVQLTMNFAINVFCSLQPPLGFHAQKFLVQPCLNIAPPHVSSIGLQILGRLEHNRQFRLAGPNHLSASLSSKTRFIASWLIINPGMNETAVSSGLVFCPFVLFF